MKRPPPTDDNSPAAIIVRPATQRLIAREAARLSCRHDFRHDDIVDIQAALRVDLFERLQSLDPGRDHVVLYLLKAMDSAFIDLARTRHRLRRRGDASTLLIDVAEPGFALSCDSFTSADRVMATCWGGGKPNRLRVGIERTQLWRFNLDGMAKLIANRAGASGRVEFSQTDRLVVAGSIQFRGTTHELFLALGASWRDARAIIAPAGRLQRSALPILLSLSRVAPFDTWLAMRPIGASVGLTSDGRALVSPWISIPSRHPNQCRIRRLARSTGSPSPRTRSCSAMFEVASSSLGRVLAYPAPPVTGGFGQTARRAAHGESTIPA
jgi:hypothetical protein